MKQHFVHIACLLRVSGWLSAGEIYKKVDKEGNITFSDQPQKEAEKIEVEPVNILERQPLTPVITPVEEVAFEYSSIAITSPENDETLRNTGDITVSGTLSPSLRGDHRIEFLDNGVALQPASKSLGISLQNLDRGTHSFVMQVIDDDGKVLISSQPVNLHVHRNFIPPPPPPPPPTP